MISDVVGTMELTLHSYDSHNEMFNILFSTGDIVVRKLQDLRSLLRNNNKVTLS